MPIIEDISLSEIVFLKTLYDAEPGTLIQSLGMNDPEATVTGMVMVLPTQTDLRKGFVPFEGENVGKLMTDEGIMNAAALDISTIASVIVVSPATSRGRPSPGHICISQSGTDHVPVMPVFLGNSHYGYAPLQGEQAGKIGQVDGAVSIGRAEIVRRPLKP